jgi:esterase/lipase superfamily enzyme
LPFNNVSSARSQHPVVASEYAESRKTAFLGGRNVNVNRHLGLAMSRAQKAAAQGLRAKRSKPHADGIELPRPLDCISKATSALSGSASNT